MPSPWTGSASWRRRSCRPRWTCTCPGGSRSAPATRSTRPSPSSWIGRERAGADDTLKIKRSTDGALLETNTNKFDDTNAYRIGLSYDVLPQTQLRFGYTYDESGQPDAHFSPRIADSDRHLFSIGAAQELAQGWTIEGGYMYVLFEDRTIASSKDYSLLRGDEINGTAAVNGKYEAHAHLIGVEVRKRF
jgi:long-chain fatty acid transport protein